VPWVNRPVALYHAPESRLILYPTSAPACRRGQLRVSQGHGGVGLGNRLERVVFTNVGSNPCLLRGYPTITGFTSVGGRRALRPTRGGTYFGRLVPADMAPGGRTLLDLATSTHCEDGQSGTTYRQLVFGLPAGGSVRGGHVSITVLCGLSMSAFGLPQRYEPSPHPAPGTPGTLRVRVQLPAAARAGSVLRYTITLVNPTTTAVALHPCPGYTQALYAPGLVLRRSFALNCDSVDTIPAQGRVGYAMQLAVPNGAVVGVAKFGWSLDNPTGPFAGRGISITG